MLSAKSVVLEGEDMSHSDAEMSVFISKNLGQPNKLLDVEYLPVQLFSSSTAVPRMVPNTA